MKQPFIIDNGTYRAVIEETPSGMFSILYFLAPYTGLFDRSRSNYFTLEEAAQVALAQVLEQATENTEAESVMAQVQHGTEAAKQP